MLFNEVSDQLLILWLARVIKNILDLYSSLWALTSKIFHLVKVHLVWGILKMLTYSTSMGIFGGEYIYYIILHLKSDIKNNLYFTESSCPNISFIILEFYFMKDMCLSYKVPSISKQECFHVVSLKSKHIWLWERYCVSCIIDNLKYNK